MSRGFMSRKYFVKFVSEPRNDTIKTIVGAACAARAIEEGHDVSVSARQAPGSSTLHT